MTTMMAFQEDGSGPLMENANISIEQTVLVNIIFFLKL